MERGKVWWCERNNNENIINGNIAYDGDTAIDIVIARSRLLSSHSPLLAICIVCSQEAKRSDCERAPLNYELIFIVFETRYRGANAMTKIPWATCRLSHRALQRIRPPEIRRLYNILADVEWNAECVRCEAVASNHRNVINCMLSTRQLAQWHWQYDGNGENVRCNAVSNRKTKCSANQIPQSARAVPTTVLSYLLSAGAIEKCADCAVCGTCARASRIGRVQRSLGQHNQYDDTRKQEEEKPKQRT